VTITSVADFRALPEIGLMLVQPTARPMGGQSGGQDYDDPMTQSRGGGVSGFPFPELTLTFR